MNRCTLADILFKAKNLIKYKWSYKSGYTGSISCTNMNVSAET